MSTLKNYRNLSGKIIQKLFGQLPDATVRAMAHKVKTSSLTDGLTYTNEYGKTKIINLTLRPRVLHPKIHRKLGLTIRALDHAFQKIAGLYFYDSRLEDLFPFEPQELPWLSIMRAPGYIPGRLVTRWDANTTFSDRELTEGFHFFEVNGVGIGGIWYGAAGADIILKTVLPELRKQAHGFGTFRNPDMRMLLLNLLLDHRRKLKRTHGVIALAMEKASGSNFIEFEFLAKLFRKMGYPTIVTEPTDFYMKNGEVFGRDKRIDVIYRDTTLDELCLLEQQGHDFTALKAGFRRGQVISSLEGEFDHKSAFEVFTDPQYSHYFSPKEREIFKHHILWTRMLRDVRTPDPKDRSVELLPFVLKNQQTLVLKPNRLYGGKGIVFGNEVTRQAWHRKIENCLKEPGGWVIQQLGLLRKKRFTSRNERGVLERDFYVVSGFFATERGLGIVGRMSEETIVNVARKGGLTPILLIK